MYLSLEEVKKIAASGEYRRIPVCRELYHPADGGGPDRGKDAGG